MLRHVVPSTTLVGLLCVSLIACKGNSETTKSPETSSETRTARIAAAPKTVADCPPGTNIIIGTEGDDHIAGTNKSDCILGLGGNDVINGGDGDDFIFGGPGDDVLTGGNGKDTIYGEEGNDVINGENGTDIRLSGGPGNDVVTGGNGNDAVTIVEGADGQDVCDAGSAACEQVGVSCKTDTQCPAGQHCLTVANAGVCVVCLASGECYDGNACTTDACVGYTCEHTPISACIAGDGCCPAGCNANNDSDCSPTCGNGVVETGETCDPAAACPTTCEDGSACTKDQMTGSAANCSVACSHTQILSCTAGDSCCPAGCNANDDADCSPSCGNGVVEAGETCDPPAACLTSCNDGNTCTIDQMTGSAANCNVACSHTVITTCATGDGCCPAGCDNNNDADCPVACGNGVVEAGETCDPPAACPTSCSDGNTCTIDQMTGSAANCNVACSHTATVACAAGDGCCPAGCNANDDSDCSPMCGNGVVESGETCDPPATCSTSCNDGNSCTIDQMTGSAANCNVACSQTAITTCASGDGCCPAGCNANSDTDCSAACGNGVVESGETCDPPPTCPTSCDDGNACTIDQMTGSAANCNVACSYTTITGCTSGDGCCPAGCNANNDTECFPSCGNGVVESGETCDLPSTCPASCDDGNACTIDQMTGNAANCNVACSNTAITTCTSGDGCCAAGCNTQNDSDCAVCGDGQCTGAEDETTCPADCAATATIRQLTDGLSGSSNYNPWIDSGQIVWEKELVYRSRCIHPNEGYYYDCDYTDYIIMRRASNTETIVDVATRPGEKGRLGASHPQISGGKIAWDYEFGDSVYCEMNGWTTALGPGNNPAISNGQIVYHVPVPGYSGYLALWDSLTGSSTTVHSGGTWWTPSIDAGRIVYNTDLGTGYKNLYFWDGTAERRVSDYGSLASLKGDQMAFTDGFTMFMFDTVSWTRKTLFSLPHPFNVSCPYDVFAGNYSESIVSLDRGRIAYSMCDGADREIWYWDGISNHQITHNNFTDTKPSLSNGQIVWQGWDGQRWQIFVATNLPGQPWSPMCGDGVVDADETCDPASSCPASCDDGNACTMDQMTGSAGNCNVACSHRAITTCTSGDGCCPASCSADNDSDCLPACNRLATTRYPLASANDASAGNKWWASLGGCLLPGDGKWTYASSYADVHTNYLKVTNFNFGIPVGATVLGLQVEFLFSETVPSELAEDYSAYLWHHGRAIGRNKATGSNLQGAGVKVYGNESDLWDAALTPEIVNDLSFGFGFAARLAGSSQPEWFSIDYVKITVFWERNCASTSGN